jgi:hypothetical protein
MLNESLLALFHEAATSTEGLARRIRGLNLRPVPPRPNANVRARFLGENPSWY